jgi:hypothetical protein
MGESKEGMTGWWAADAAAARAFSVWRNDPSPRDPVRSTAQASAAFRAGYYAALADAAKSVEWFGHATGCGCDSCHHARKHWSAPPQPDSPAVLRSQTDAE